MQGPKNIEKFTAPEDSQEGGKEDEQEQIEKESLPEGESELSEAEITEEPRKVKEGVRDKLGKAREQLAEKFETLEEEASKVPELAEVLAAKERLESDFTETMERIEASRETEEIKESKIERVKRVFSETVDYLTDLAVRELKKIADLATDLTAGGVEKIGTAGVRVAGKGARETIDVSGYLGSKAAKGAIRGAFNLPKVVRGGV